MFTFEYLVFLVVSALAVKHASYILMHGSIFDGLRNEIQDRMSMGVFGFEKLNELFTCKVCMTTQVSLWFVAFPVCVSGYFPTPGLVATLMLFGITAFAVSALATWLWNVTEYDVQKFEALRAQHESEKNHLLSRLSDANTRSVSAMSPSARVNEDQFVSILTALETKCQGIGCGYARRDCRQDSLRANLANLMDSGELSASLDCETLVMSFQQVLPDYFRDRWRHKKSPAKLSEFRRRTFKRFEEEAIYA